MISKHLLVLVFLFHFTFGLLGQSLINPSPTPPEWTTPFRPFRIAGNLYYVGSKDLACYLIVTSQGNILINTGLASSTAMIKANIESLGFRFEDIRLLLTNQAHYDHMGAMAEIKKLTGAKLEMDAMDAGVAGDGGRSDFAFSEGFCPYAPVKADKLLKNGDTIKLGDIELLFLHHPGHTKGSCSYLFKVKDENRTYRVLIANMPTIVTEKRFSDIPAYPNIARDYAYTFQSMKNLSFDIWLASHASQFNLQNKQAGSGYNPAAFIDRSGYDNELKNLERTFLKKEKEK